MEKLKVTNCKVCQAEIAKSAKVCTSCGAKNKKPIYKRVWFWLIIVVVLLSIGGLGGSGDATDPVATDDAAVTEQEESVAIDDASQDVVVDVVPAAPVVKEPSVTMGQKNALNKALDYLDYTAFSYNGLVKQLEYEGFSNSDATYAVSSCGADWNEQAAIKAADYLDYSSFSRDSLITQLEYEGFSNGEAVYGAGAVGY